MRPIRVDFSANGTYAPDHMLMRHSGGSRGDRYDGGATEDPARKPGKLFGYARVSTTDQDLALRRGSLV
jgi:hypothetical protein